MDSSNKFKKQVLTEITVGSILSSAINGIVGFIAVYLFKPLWDKIVSYWKKQ